MQLPKVRQNQILTRQFHSPVHTQLKEHNIRQSQQIMNELKYQKIMIKTPTIQFSELPQTEQQHLVEVYTDMLNMENDLYYLFDSFKEVLNKIINKNNQFTSPAIQITNNNKSEWFQTGNTHWSGGSQFIVKFNTQMENSRSKIQSNTAQSQPRLQESLKMDFGIDESGDFNQTPRVGKMIFSLEFISKQLFQEGKKVISLYSLQNNNYKAHLGFCQISVNFQQKEMIIHKLYIAKYHLVNTIKYLINTYNPERIKIKINSTQSQMNRLLQDLGFKLRSKISIPPGMEVLTLGLQSGDLNLTFKPPTQKSYL